MLTSQFDTRKSTSRGVNNTRHCVHVWQFDSEQYSYVYCQVREEEKQHAILQPPSQMAKVQCWTVLNLHQTVVADGMSSGGKIRIFWESSSSHRLNYKHWMFSCASRGLQFELVNSFLLTWQLWTIQFLFRSRAALVAAFVPSFGRLRAFIWVLHG